MLKLFGHRESFAIEIENSTEVSRTMNLYINGKFLSVDDNSAYIPGIIPHLEGTLVDLEREIFAENREYFFGLCGTSAFRKLNDPFNIDLDELSDEEYERHSLITDISHHHSILDWGPTTDNITAYYYPLNGEMMLSAAFWREDHEPPGELNEVYTTAIEPMVLQNILKQALACCEKGLR